MTLIDSPVANVANIARALRTVGASLDVTREPEAIARSRKIVLPGVGSFTAAMRWLDENGIARAIRDAVSNGSALMGICVGHQLLFDVSYEMGVTSGLGLVRGEVRLFEGTLPIPQIGWNSVWINDVPGAVDRDEGGPASPLFDGIANGASFYFVNSYAASDVPHEVARADYGGSFTAAVQNGRVFGVQFHPEKSSHAGLRVLRNFVENVA